MQNSIVAAINGNALQVVYLGADRLPRLVWQGSNGVWSGYGVDNLLPNPRPLSAMSICVNPSGYLQIIGIGAIDQHPYLLLQDPQSNWSSYALDQLANGQENSQQYFSPACGIANDGSTQVFILFTDVPFAPNGEAFSQPPGTTNWNDNGAHEILWNLNELGYGSFSAQFITAIDNPSALLSLVAVGTNPFVQPPLPATPYVLTQLSPEPAAGYNNAPPGAGWNYATLPALPTPWTGKNFFAVASCYADQGQFNGSSVVVCLGADDGLPYCFLEDSNNDWSFLGQLSSNAPHPFTAVTMAPGNNGTIQIILLGTDCHLYLIYMDPSRSVGETEPTAVFAWAGQLSPPNTPNLFFNAFTAATGADGNLQLIVSALFDDQPYLIWQDQHAGVWNWYGALPTSY
jgi:hypothetical protein